MIKIHSSIITVIETPINYFLFSIRR